MSFQALKRVQESSCCEDVGCGMMVERSDEKSGYCTVQTKELVIIVLTSKFDLISIQSSPSVDVLYLCNLDYLCKEISATTPIRFSLRHSPAAIYNYPKSYDLFLNIIPYWVHYFECWNLTDLLCNPRK
jgi:hypothetical protein